VVQLESFIFCHYLWISWHRGFYVFSMAGTKCTGLIKPWSNFGVLFCLTKSKVLVVCQFFYNCGNLLQVTIAFVLKIFSFSDREKVLDLFDRHCWDAACYSRMSEVRDYRCCLLAVKWFSAFPLISCFYV